MKRLAFFLLMFTCLGVANAQKFALVDMEYIIQHIPDYEKANQQLEQQSQKCQAEIEVKVKEAETLYKEYQQNSASFSAAQRTSKEDAIVAKEKEVAELKKKYFGPDGIMAKQQESLLSPIQNQVYEAIKEVSIRNNYAMVIDRSTEQSIIFALPSIDISNEVLLKLGYSN
ncbi:MAG: OmpH family outer membrane protein [Phocaeicola sp.]